MFRIATWLFQMPYHYDRTGVRVIAMCPGVTDTPLISEAHHRQLRDDWGDEAGRELDELPKQKWVFATGSGISYRIPTILTLLDTVTTHFLDFASSQETNSDTFVTDYLTTIFQQGKLHIVECKSVKNCG